MQPECPPFAEIICLIPVILVHIVPEIVDGERINYNNHIVSPD